MSSSSSTKSLSAAARFTGLLFLAATGTLLSGCQSMPDLLPDIPNPFASEESASSAKAASSNDGAKEDADEIEETAAPLPAPIYDAAASRARNILNFYYSTKVKDLEGDSALQTLHPLPALLQNAEPSTFGESYRDYFSPSKIADFFGKATENVLHGEDMQPHLLGFIPLDSAKSRSDAERRFVSESARVFKVGAESLGFEVKGALRGYRLEGMIEAAAELRLTLVNPALGCPAPQTKTQNAQNAQYGHYSRSTVRQDDTNSSLCTIRLRVQSLDEETSPSIRAPIWLAEGLHDTPVHRFGQGSVLTVKLPDGAQVRANDIYSAIAKSLPAGWAVYLPPAATHDQKTEGTGSVLFTAPQVLEATGILSFVKP